MNNELVLAGRALVPTNTGPDIIDMSLSQQIETVATQIEDLSQKIEGAERSIGMALNQLSFLHPDIAGRLREQINRLRLLQGEMPIPDRQCPLTRRDKNGVNDEEEAAKMDREAEDAAIEKLKQMDDKDLPPEVRKVRVQMRIQKEKCKKFYAWLAQRTHPDRVKDTDLNPIFQEAKAAYDDLNLSVLKRMVKELKEFLRMREKHKRTKYRDFKLNRLREKLGIKQDLEEDLEKLKSGLAYRCLEAFQTKTVLEARRQFEEFVETQCDLVEDAIAASRSAMRVQERTRMPAALKAKLMAEFFDDD